MKTTELYTKTPIDRHQENVFSGDRLFFNGKEYIINGDEELRLIHSPKGLGQRLEQILTKLSVT